MGQVEAGGQEDGGDQAEGDPHRVDQPGVTVAPVRVEHGTQQAAQQRWQGDAPQVF